MNPGLRAPSQVAEDNQYEVMRDYAPRTWYPPCGEMIVRHRLSSTFWRAVYAVRKDNSDFSAPAKWDEVFPKKVTTTVYCATNEAFE